jgi:DNA-binding beta-propeller fold protein YncE
MLSWSRQSRGSLIRGCSSFIVTKEIQMKRILFTFLLVFTSVVLFISGRALASDGKGQAPGKIVVANRATSTISVIDVGTDTVVGTYDLPGDNPAEPMYVTYSHFGDRVFVGDRANNQVVVFNADDFSVEATVPAGAGVFHMWADSRGRQLWVNNDIDNTATVIDPRTLEVLSTVPMPADLVALGGKPHDVILDRAGRFAYVSLIGVAGANDYLVQFSTRTFEELNRAEVGKDPHLSLANRGQYLYVPAQGSNKVSVLNRFTLELVTEIAVSGAHGAGMRTDGRVFYTTNISGGGADGLVAINTRTMEVLGAADTPYAVPHNIALTPRGDKLFVTHSGATSDKVSIYSASLLEPVPTYAGEVTVGFNPFGLAYVP